MAARFALFATLAITCSALVAGSLSLPVAAHDGVVHATPEDAARHLAETRAKAGAPVAPADGPVLPFPVQVDGRFDLVDHFGNARSDQDFHGTATLIFFGYANCEAICSVALPRMAQAVDLLTPETADQVQPLLITVDPRRDTPDVMREIVPEIHPRLVGLTGTDNQLAEAYASFQVEAKEVAIGPDGQPIYAHGSFIYLMGPDGELLTVLPPILGPDRMAALIEKYV